MILDRFIKLSTNKLGETLRFRRMCRVLDAALRVRAITGENTDKLIIEIVWNWFRYGSSDEDFLTFEFYRKNSREKKRWLTSAKNNRYLYKTVYDDFARSCFDNKEIFDDLFKPLMKHDFLILKNANENDIRSFLKKYDEVIVKPAGGACGVGIFKINNGDNEALNDLINRIKNGDNLIMEQVIIQHNDMAKVNPSSVNTIRVITMVDSHGDVHIINTLAKFGGSSSCISNTMGGGICCHIDEDTGILDRPGKDIHGESHFRHPVTGVIIPGYQIPNWESLCDYAKKLAKVVPSGRYIGWDIVILADGYDVIEGNIHPGQDFQGCDGVGRWNEIKKLI